MNAFKIIKEKISNAKLILIGKGSEEEKIRNQIKRYKVTDNVALLEDIQEDRLYSYFAFSDIYFSPTLDTGSIQGVIESMACGLPVRSTGQEIWVKSGINGYIVPKRDSEARAKSFHASNCEAHPKES